MQQKRRILQVNVGYPGSVHDTRVWLNSEVARDIQGHLGGPLVNVNGIEVPQMLVADAGYPMLPWLLTPFPGHNLNPVQASFNFKHSSTRMCIEQLNGELKGVQRFLLTKIQNPKIDRLPTYVLACCVLHNLRIERGDVMDRSLRGPDIHFGLNTLGSNPGLPTGVSNYERSDDIRKAIAEYLFERNQ